MSQIEKLLKKFTNRPQSVKYIDIEKILIFLGFEKIFTKGSHVKWKHHSLQNDIIIPVHNNDCKIFYKEQIFKIIKVIIKK